MSHLGSLGSSPQFLSWLQTLSPSSLEDALQQLHEVSQNDSSEDDDNNSVSQSKKVRDEDILALMPPPPMLNLVNIQLNSPSFSNEFGIERASLQSNIGLTESAVVLAAATSWAKAQMAESDLVKEIVASQEKNPLATTLSQYISQSQFVGLDALALQQMFRQTPVVSSMLHGIDPTLALKAYQVAEQQIVLTMLDKWIDMEAQRAAQMRIQIKNDDIISQEITHRLLKDYVQDISTKREDISQPVLSVLVSAVVLGVTGASTIQVATGVQGAASSIMNVVDEAMSMVPALIDPIKTELALLTTGLLATAAAWATPVAMTLYSKTSNLSPGESDRILNRDSARSFAITLATFLTNPAIDKLFLSRLEKASESGLISKDAVDRFLACLKISLLIHALALLYKTEHGGITAPELQLYLKNPEARNDEISSLLVKLITEQEVQLDPATREDFINRLVSRYDSSDSKTAESLIEPIKAFLSMWSPQIQSQLTGLEKA